MSSVGFSRAAVNLGLNKLVHDKDVQKCEGLLDILGAYLRPFRPCLSCPFQYLRRINIFLACPPKFITQRPHRCRRRRIIPVPSESDRHPSCGVRRLTLEWSKCFPFLGEGFFQVTSNESSTLITIGAMQLAAPPLEITSLVYWAQS